MFTAIDGICIPDCYKFFTRVQERLEINVKTLLVLGSFGILISLVLFAASFWRRKLMLVFYGCMYMLY